MVTGIGFDEDKQIRRLMTTSNFHAVFEMYEQEIIQDFPLKNEEINWYPKWGAFYWMT
jgi:hypothetical protein